MPTIALYLGILLFSFLVTSIAIVPAIDLLYRIQFIKKEVGTPAGGGVLLLIIVTSLFALLFPLASRFGVYVTSHFPIRYEINSFFFTFVSFGLLGLYEDLHQILKMPKANIPFWLLKIVLSCCSSLFLFFSLHINIVNLPGFGVVHLGAWFIPLMTMFIYIFIEGFEALKDLNGLAGGILLIVLLALWSISFGSVDTPLSILIAIWIGTLIAFLYFNIYPARILLGSAGSLAFGATLPVTGTLIGRPVAVVVIGGLFVLAALYKLIAPKKTPIIFLQKNGWSEPKIVFRSWIVAIVLAIGGLWLGGI